LAKGKLEVRWLNPFKDCIQLSLQRSTDGTHYSTVKTVQTPNLYENRFVDLTAPQIPKVFYRITYVLKNGEFNLSEARSSADIFQAVTKPAAPRISKSVFADQQGNIRINIAEPKRHQYRIKFMDDKGVQIFQINKIESNELVLDKTNFIHAGWFLYEFYEDEQLKDKSKIYLKKIDPTEMILRSISHQHAIKYFFEISLDPVFDFA